MKKPSPRLGDRKSLVSVKVVGMNLRGTGEFDGILWNKKEIFTTDFMVVVSFRNFSWTIQKDFESCKAFLLEVLPSKRQAYEEAFPKIHDVNDDVFILVNRKEAMENFLHELVSTMDFLVYRPLFYFLSPKNEISPLIEKLKLIQAACRQFLTKVSMEVRLMNFFSKSLEDLLNRLKNGIKVALIPSQKELESTNGCIRLNKKILYFIENSVEFGLSRLCLIKFEDYVHTVEMIKKNTEAGGFCNPDFVSSLPGIYLSDIAEIRHGMASHGFSQFVDFVEKKNVGRREVSDEGGRKLLHRALEQTKNDGKSHYVSTAISIDEVCARNCFSIVSFERTLDLQLLDVEEGFTGVHFADMLSLLSLKSIMTSRTPDCGYAGKESVLRLRNWKRVKTNYLYLMKNSRDTSTSSSCNNLVGAVDMKEVESTLPKISNPNLQHVNHRIPPRRLVEAQLFMEILCESIEIEEERFDNSQPNHECGTIEANKMWLEPGLMRIYIMPSSVAHSEESNLHSARGINVDDISEVRPGKVSFACDGTPYRTSLSLIGSEGTICLPVDSVDIRNALLRQFQSFLMAYRNPGRCISSSPVFGNTGKLSAAASPPLTPSRWKKTAEKLYKNSSRRRSFHSHYPEARPPTGGSGYMRRKSTPASPTSAASHPYYDNVNSFWVKKSETEADESSCVKSSSLPSSFLSDQIEHSTPSSTGNLFKKLFSEASPDTKESPDSRSLQDIPPPDSPVMSLDSTASGGLDVTVDNRDGLDCDDPCPQPQQSPFRRASAAFLSVVRRNSRRGSSMSDTDVHVAPLDSSEYDNSNGNDGNDGNEPSTVIVGDLPLPVDVDEKDDLSDSPVGSVESYQSDEEEESTPSGDNEKKSAIRRASLKMMNLVRRMSTANMDDDDVASEKEPCQ